MEKEPFTGVVRRAARVLLLDAQDRILLMKGRLPGALPGSAAWFTIGGGVEQGEGWREAAVREIREETGLSDPDLGPTVWRREGVLRLPEPTWVIEQYVVARCGEFRLATDGWNALERELIEDVRWWTLAELLITTEPVVPPGLAQRLPDILAGVFPAEPELIPWD